MSDLRSNLGRRSPAANRRRAAERVVDEVFSAAPTQVGPGERAEAGEELASMRSIVTLLGQLPAAAWETEPGTVREPELGTAGTATLGTAGAAGRSVSRRHPVLTRPRWAGALVTAVMALMFVAGALTHPFAGASSPRTPSLSAAPHVALQPLPGAPRDSAAVAYMPGGDHMVLEVKHLRASAPGTYYELWLMNSNTSLVSVTSFRVAAGSSPTLRLVLPDAPSHYRYLDISVQQVGRDARISADNVLRGAI